MTACTDLYECYREKHRNINLGCIRLVFLIGAVLLFTPFVVLAGGFNQKIHGISVSNEQIVLGPGGVSINSCNGCNLILLSDEHSTIFPPGTFKHHPHDYLFFAAPKGVIVLTGGDGPDVNGQWTLDYAQDYGRWWPSNPPGFQNGAVFNKRFRTKAPMLPTARGEIWFVRAA